MRPELLDLMTEAEAAIDQERLVTTLQALIRIPSENPFDHDAGDNEGEEAVANYLDDRLRRLGAATELQRLGHRRVNLIAHLDGADPDSGPSLMLAGHMDTVRTTGYPDAYSAAVRDGRVYGRGSCDMKAALACYLEVVEALRAVAGSRLPAPLAGRLWIVGVADEEYQMTGARAIGRHGPHVDAVIIGEPTELEICVAAKGRVSTYIVTRGRAAHSSMPEQGVNAIIHMGRVLHRLERYGQHLLREGPEHPLLGRPRVNPGVIRGGVQVNMVPDYCELEVDRRTLPHENRNIVYAELEGLLREVAAETPGFQAELTEPTWLIPPLETPPDHPVVQALGESIAEVLGRTAQPKGFVAGTDAAHFGSPAVLLGPGSLEQAHTTDEFVPIDDLVHATRIYLRTIIRFLSRPAAG